MVGGALGVNVNVRRQSCHPVSMTLLQDFHGADSPHLERRREDFQFRNREIRQ